MSVDLHKRTIELLSEKCERLVECNKVLLEGCLTAIKYIKQRQVYDKDALNVLELAINKCEEVSNE